MFVILLPFYKHLVTEYVYKTLILLIPIGPAHQKVCDQNICIYTYLCNYYTAFTVDSI